MTSRLRDFVGMTSPIFHGSKVGDDPQEFQQGVYKTVHVIGGTSTEKVEFAS